MEIVFLCLVLSYSFVVSLSYGHLIFLQSVHDHISFLGISHIMNFILLSFLLPSFFLYFPVSINISFNVSKNYHHLLVFLLFPLSFSCTSLSFLLASSFYCCLLLLQHFSYFVIYLFFYRHNPFPVIFLLSILFASSLSSHLTYYIIIILFYSLSNCHYHFPLPFLTSSLFSHLSYSHHYIYSSSRPSPSLLNSNLHFHHYHHYYFAISFSLLYSLLQHCSSETLQRRHYLETVLQRLV